MCLKMRLLSLLILTTLLLSACQRLTEGEVYNKEFKPSEEILMLMPIVISNGETSDTIFMPYYEYYPDRWVISIRAYDKDKKKYITDSFYVSKEVYDSVEIQDWFVFDDNLGSRGEPCDKEKVE